MSDNQPDPPEQNTPPEPDAPVIGRGLLWMAAAALAIPALVPLLVLIEPRLVPFIPPVDSSDLTMVLFLIGLSVLLLAVNWGFLFVMYRWINKYGGRQ
jgi:hypothetical protein